MSSQHQLWKARETERMSDLIEGKWDLYLPAEADGAIPARIFCGMVEVATVNCHEAAKKIVDQHNNDVIHMSEDKKAGTITLHYRDGSSKSFRYDSENNVWEAVNG